MTRRAQAPRDERGFSVLEALVSMALFLIVFVAVVATYLPNLAIHNSGESKVDVQQNARLALSDMARAIRMAGYFPENFASPAADPPLAVPIRLGGPTLLAIYGDTNGSGASTVTMFCQDGTFLRRTRGAVGLAASYTCSAGEIVADSVAGVTFTYFDENNAIVGGSLLDGAAAGAVPAVTNTADRGRVRKVVIALTTVQELPHGEQQLYTLSSEVRLRNVI
jgi:Tfp pilus assembly protein PilW